MATEDPIDLTPEQVDRAERLHEDITVVDGLVPTDAYLVKDDYRDHLHRGGIGAGNFTVASRSDYRGATEAIQDVHELVKEHADLFVVVDSTETIAEADEEGKVGVIIGFQDSMPAVPISREDMDPGFEYLRSFQQMGVRIIQLTYNNLNYIGAGACERRDPGLSYYGQDFVDEMNERGLVVDLSHCGDRTTMEAIERSNDPVIISHANPRAVAPLQGRNKTDEHIEALADKGGVIGITVFPPLVKVNPDSYEVLQATVHDVVDHIDHVVDLVGVDHVAFGTDMNDHALDTGTTPEHSALRHFRPDHPEVYGRGPEETYDPYPRGVDRHEKIGNLTGALVERGYSDDDIEKIMGGNLLRVFETVWGE